MADLQDPDNWRQARADAAAGPAGRWARRAPWLIGAAGALLFASGFVHIVHGEALGFHVWRKVSWSLSETVVNSDVVANLPMFMARSQYPLLMGKLEQIREGFDQPGFTQRNFGRVHIGMQLGEVRALLGEPAYETPYFGFGDDERRLLYSDALTSRSATLVFSCGRLVRIEN